MTKTQSIFNLLAGKFMKPSNFLTVLIMLLLTACGTFEFNIEGTPTPAVSASATSKVHQLIAYKRNKKLLITDITNSEQGNTMEYALAGIDDYPVEIAWSPSGNHLALSTQINQAPRVFSLWNLGTGAPVDIGPGSNPTWSPDGRSIAYSDGQFPDENLWITKLPNPAPQQLTFEKNFAWGSWTFAPNGQTLVVAGQSRNLQAAVGNFESYAVESLALDSSGVRSPFQPTGFLYLGSHLPSDLRFSRNGKWLAFSTSSHVSACGAVGTYYAMSADGNNQHTLSSSSLRKVADLNPLYIYWVSGYAWSPSSEALAISGGVQNCDNTSSDYGKPMTGPQLSVVGLDGTERLVIPGLFHGLSYDCTGNLIAVGHYKDIQDINPTIEIYSTQTGQLILSLGAGSYPAFQSCVP
jgi:hypothetical protein